MTRVLIIEDEYAAVENLTYLLAQIDTQYEVIKVMDSVEESSEYLASHSNYDLIFMDIHLADGLSFEICQKVDIQVPIIFATAYDQYAIRAFKENSIDYLLKPLKEDDLSSALEKFERRRNQTSLSSQQLNNLIGLIQADPKSYRQSYLVRRGESFIPLNVEDVAFFFIENGIVRATTMGEDTFHLDGKLEDVESELDPQQFFRANRQYLVHRRSIQELNIYFNGRLIVKTNPEAKEKVIVSKANATKIKNWLSSR